MKPRVLTAAQTALIVALLILVSKGLGFIREWLMALYYGTSYVVDAFDIANSIPSMLFAGIWAALSTSFIPIFSSKKELEGEKAANLFTSSLINILIIVAIISSLIGILFSKQLVTIFTMPPEFFPPEASTIFGKITFFFGNIGEFLTHGWVGEKADLAIFYIKVTFAYCLFTAVAGIFDSYLRYNKAFISPILASYMFNIVAIPLIIISAKVADPRIIVFGSFIGHGLRLIILLIIAVRKKYKYSFSFRFSGAIREIFTLAIPVFIGTSVWQINSFVSKVMASGLTTGSLAALAYSALLIMLLAGSTSEVINMILFPKLSRAYTLGENDHYSYVLNTGVSTIVIIGLPLTMGALLYSKMIVQIVFERGAFDEMSTSITAIAFFYSSFGLIFVMLNSLLTSAFYSRHNTKTPLIIGIVAVVVNIVFSVLLIIPLKHGGLALAGSISAFVNAIGMIVCFKKTGSNVIRAGFAIKVIKIVISTVVSVGGTYLIYRAVWSWFEVNDWVRPRMAFLTIIILLAAAIYWMLLRAFKIKELSHLKQLFKFSKDDASIIEN